MASNLRSSQGKGSDQTRRGFKSVTAELDRRRRVALGFERIEALLKLLGSPQESLCIVQVVGTNGKGTTAVALAGALTAAGEPAGVYLSPHVLSYTERVMLRGRFASEEEFAAAMGRVMDISDAHGINATQFELLTAGALLMFREAGLSWAVLEAGLGARYDATTAAEPGAVVLTNVGLDHTEYLGDTVEEIAAEKLASLSPGAVLVLGTDDPRVVRLARQEAGRVGARVVEFGGVVRPPREGVPYVVANRSLGARAAEVLLGRALRDEEKAAAFAADLLPARFEEHEMNGVPVVVDGGHNPEGLAAALSAVRGRYGTRPLGVVFGVLKDKDIGTMLRLIGDEAQALVLALPSETNGRAYDPKQILEEYEPKDARGRRARVEKDPGDALDLVIGEMGEIGGVVLVTGSLSTGAVVLRRLRGG